MLLLNTSTDKVIKTTPTMLRNIKVKSFFSDVSYLKKITIKECKKLGYKIPN